MTVFADSSAIVKRYVPEPDHEAVRSIDGTIVVSSISRVEVVSAFWRKHRLGELTAADALVLSDEFLTDLEDDGDDPSPFHVVPVGEAVIDEALALVARHGLRAYDAVQLATAVMARERVPELAEIAAFDRALRQAAAIEGFRLLPTE